ncbi:lipopolysaccharide core heptosyltransferase RfaQ [Superficieibacter sp.]|uniref:lipopolysaccharide core heptosyltransferase RfaQ n=1 Tax=Superficieibacter sp. TaxID=2303322 RepID=UPI0028A9B431|nr:lipopolysaccharide core heptosyltransferase RfaQ [Superficieibacter sp.]
MRKYKKILIIKLKFQGDVLLTTPVVNTLKEHFPDAEIDMMVYKSTVQIISEHINIHKIYGVADKKASPLEKLRNICQVIKEVRANKYDLVVNLSSQIALGLVMRCIPAPMKIGFNFGRQKSKYWVNAYDKTLDDACDHIVPQNLSILTLLGIDRMVNHTSMTYEGRHWQRLKARMDELGLTKEYVVVQPTARQIFKCWDNDKFAAVINHLMGKGYDVVLTSGPGKEDAEIIDDIVSQCTVKPVTEFAGKTSFPELAALIDHAILFIGVDSAPGHIAAAVDTPVVCLFGATKHRFWHPWTEKLELIWAGDYKTMPLRKDLDRSFRYLTYIPAEDVICAADRMLTRYPAPKTLFNDVK